MILLVLVAAVRARDEFDTSRALTWPLLVGFVLVLLGSTYLWSVHELRPRAPH
jgi:hypothetical protein